MCYYYVSYPGVRERPFNLKRVGGGGGGGGGGYVFFSKKKYSDCQCC